MTEQEIRSSERMHIKTLIELDLMVKESDTPEQLVARVLQLIDTRDSENA